MVFVRVCILLRVFVRIVFFVFGLLNVIVMCMVRKKGELFDSVLKVLSLVVVVLVVLWLFFGGILMMLKLCVNLVCLF